MKKLLRPSIIILWIGCCAFVLFLTLSVLPHDESDEALIIFKYLMLYLTFPIGYIYFPVAVGALRFLYEKAGPEVLSPAWAYVFVWIGFLLVGYFQWFWLIPTLWRRVRHAAQDIKGGASIA